MEQEPDIEQYLAKHYIHRSNWLRAAVLGANDGIISCASLAVGVASAGAERSEVILAGLAGLVAGALSMAAGEYVSVSSQTDLERADIAREARELKEAPQEEQAVLAKIYRERGLSAATAAKVAEELTEADALTAHVRDELGITEMNKAKPMQAAFSSGAAFTAGAFLPLMMVLFSPEPWLEYVLFGSTLVFLMALGGIAAKAGGAPPLKAMLRVSLWGMVAMGLTALVGYWFGAQA